MTKKKHNRRDYERKLRFLPYTYLILKAQCSVPEVGKSSCDLTKYIKIHFNSTETFAESYTITPFSL